MLTTPLAESTHWYILSERIKIEFNPMWTRTVASVPAPGFLSGHCPHQPCDCELSDGLCSVADLGFAGPAITTASHSRAGLRGISLNGLSGESTS
ncbi:hypothetical protein RRG08_060146 [Elysia crispata]|uniref:Uncharacterized protein n=1 Tax=Elysia crispata TaxID=231223 RepID=A0AAE0ZZ12_9GAST|nr:hypothetical protein RRG08_060146 [Elysia crispata]